MKNTCVRRSAFHVVKLFEFVTMKPCNVLNTILQRLKDERRPILTNDNVDILLPFRIHQVGLVADIEKVFLMIGISRVDRDCLRFLWFQDIMTEENPKLI